MHLTLTPFSACLAFTPHLSEQGEIEVKTGIADLRRFGSLTHTHTEWSEGRDGEIAQIACMIKLPQAPEALPIR